MPVRMWCEDDAEDYMVYGFVMDPDTKKVRAVCYTLNEDDYYDYGLVDADLLTPIR